MRYTFLPSVLLPLALLIVLASVSCRKEVDSCEGLTVTYDVQIKTIVEQNCAISGCHVPGGDGRGDFTSYAGIREKADNGSLRFMVVETKQMPQNGSLTEEQINLIDCWVENGAPEN